MPPMKLSDVILRPFVQLSTWDGVSFGQLANGFGFITTTSQSVREGFFRHADDLGDDAWIEHVQKTIGMKTSSDSEHEFFPLNLPPGSYFPRMARPHHHHPGDFPTNYSQAFNTERAAAIVQIVSLTDWLSRCLVVVESDPRNMQVFGNEFRNILILASTEFEAQAKGVLRANYYTSSRNDGRWTTADFVKLEPALRLADYIIDFPRFPQLPMQRPFEGWTTDQPTSSLGWYDAYNQVKHDRERHFEKASLSNALAAVSGVVVICLAQFGISILRESRILGEMFNIKVRPWWCSGDTHGADGIGGQAINYPFST